MTIPPPLDDYAHLLAWLQEEPQRAAALVLYLAEEEQFTTSRGSNAGLPPGLRAVVESYASVRRDHVAQFGAGAESALEAEEQRLRALIEEWKQAWRALRE